MFSNETIFFAGFALFVMLVMLLDLGAFSRKKSHEVSFKEAGIWSGIWVLLSIAFYFFISKYGYLVHGIETTERLTEVKNLYARHLKLNGASFAENLQIFQNNMSLEYITGYLVEYSLSADNIFVFILILNSFGVHRKFYKKILVWGILGAIILRFVFIFVGSALLQRFEWIVFIFGAFLVYTGIKLFFGDDEDEKIEPARHPVVKFVSKYMNVYKRNVIDHFFVKNKAGKLFITPLFVVVIVIAFTDLVFAVDSIPAIFSITKDPYIVFFSNVFAVMGLRSMFFFLSSIMGMFRFLKIGLAVLLTFIGIKMLAHHYLEAFGFTTIHSLYVIIGILGVSIGASLLFPKKEL
ncbi:tellurite resistance protein TerC [Pseudarcicella hirudinis]|uniref:Tellurite resistance protein TerC n=1 Tax=Pseudarcicella hirudinis TaxID=1079859 RepID=A0A1I5QPI2_9BACT|nr:TerC/Alx family metal homeostasis membrane protein [Pseudarcicella hirudinis]SFP47776.1 tellurite resistance protein TerC [Pseudarcicella hirudinis]